MKYHSKFKDMLSSYTYRKFSEEEVYANLIQKLDLDSKTFEQQKNFRQDSNPDIIVCCSRRAGKTNGIAHKLLESACSGKNFDCLYIARTRQTAKELLWDLLNDLLKNTAIRIVSRISELSIKIIETGSIISLRGAEDESDIVKLLGRAYRLVVVDEAQGYPAFLENMCESIIRPALGDLNGQLILCGTPNRECQGYFFDIWHNSNWKKHHWTCWDNPFYIGKALKYNKELSTVEDVLQYQLKRSNLNINDPMVRRDWFGEWVKSEEVFVYSYSSTVNDAVQIEPNADWRYVLGADIGYDDDDAIVVIGYSQYSKDMYLAYEYKQPKNTIEKFFEELEKAILKYRPHTSVIDCGGLGKKTVESIIMKHNISILAAEKERKLEFIEFLNSDMKNGYVKIPKTSMLAREMQCLVWNYDDYARGKKIEDRRHPNHLCDAFLYAWRYIYNTRLKTKMNLPKKGTLEWEDMMMQNLALKRVKEKQSQNYRKTYWQ